MIVPLKHNSSAVIGLLLEVIFKFCVLIGCTQYVQTSLLFGFSLARCQEHSPALHLASVNILLIAARAAGTVQSLTRTLHECCRSRDTPLF